MVEIIRHGATNLFLVAGTDPDRARFAVVIDPNHTGPDPEELGETWGTARYAFFPAEKARDFLVAGEDLWNTFQSQLDIRIGWFESVGGTSREVRVPVDAPPDSPITNDLQLGFRNYELQLPQGCCLGFGNNGFLFSFASLPLAPRFRRGKFSVAIQGDTVQLAVIDPESKPVSRFECSLALNSSLPGVPDDFDRLDVGLRYFRQVFDVEREVEQIGDPDSIVSRRFAVFDASLPFVPSGNVAMRAYLDFFHQHATRDEDSDTVIADSFLEFDTRQETRVGTFFRTSHGQRLILTPRASRLLFIDKPHHLIDPPQQYYLAPDGDFEIEHISNADGTIVESDRSNRMVCGNSGQEYIYFRRRDRMSFASLQSAFYKMPEPPLDPEEEPNGATVVRELSNTALTSWMRLLPQDEEQLASYRAQPDDAPLYTPLPKDPDIDPGEWPTVGQEVFQFQQIEIKDLLHEAPPAFPIAPAEGFRPTISGEIDRDILPLFLDWTNREYVALESLVLQPKRREIITSLPVPLPARVEVAADAADEFQDTVTPQGLLVQTNPGQSFRFETLRLATSKTSTTQVAASEEPFLAFQEVFANQNFVNALQSNRVFAVMSKIPEGVVFTDNEFHLLSWAASFEFDRAKAPEIRPLLIIKMYDGKTFAELAEDESLWAHGLHTTDDRSAVLSFVKRIQDKHRKEQLPAERKLPLYKGIYEKLHDPHWNGILGINLGIGVDNLPDELKALSIGINFDHLRWDHVGFNATRFKGNSDGKIESLRTPAFALMDYKAPDEDEPVGGPAYAFLVRELQVLFEQSALRHFGAKVELATLRVFKQETDADTNKVILFGIYENKDGVDTYTFAYAGENKIEFDVVDSFVESLTIRRVALVTSVPENSDQRTATFFISGEFNAGKTTEQYLCVEKIKFKDLAAEFSFDDTNRLQPVKFEPGLLSFDFSDNECSSTLLKFIPLKLREFFFSFAETVNELPSLQDLGFLPLAVASGPVDDEFKFDYGFSFDLELGSLGKLVPSLKDFKAELFLGWRENKSNLPILGMKFPEGRFEIGIQGVLKLIIDNVKVIIEPAVGESDPYYAIALRDCTLQILGLSIPDAPGSGDEFTIFLFPNPDEPLGDRVGWFGGLTFGDSQEQFVGLGQRLRISEQPDPSGRKPVNFDDIIRVLQGYETTIGDVEEPKLRDSLNYSRLNEWTAGFDLEITTGISLGLIFNDPHLYAMKIDIADLFGLQVIYRKISDDLGVYAAEIRLPDAVRQIELGAASLTLPVIGIEVYTNGDFRLDLGFPFQLDFTRCFNLQIIPFIGKGGFYVGRLLGVATNMLPNIDADARVAVFGLGMSLGLGKEMKKGIFSFGVSVSIYGVLEGALGYEEQDSDVLPPGSYALVGRVGIIGILFGSVDFGVVKASVHITIEIGMPFRIQKLPGLDFEISVPGIEANVNVRVEFVIKTFKVFGKKITISITYSFDLHLRLDFPIESGGGNAVSAVGVAPLIELAAEVENTTTEIDWDEDLFSDLYTLLEA